MKSVTGRYSHQGGDVTWYENTQDLVGATQLTQQKKTFGCAMGTFVYMIQSILIESNFGPPLAEQIPDMHSPILAEQKRAKLFARPETLGKTHKITDPGMLTITRMGIGKCIRGLTERPALEDWLGWIELLGVTNKEDTTMESRSFYEQAKELERISTKPEAKPWSIEAGAVGNRKERRAQAARERRWAKRKAKVNAAIDA